MAGSVLGAFSLTYCNECLSSEAEPLDILVSIIDDAGENGIAEWVKRLRSYHEGKYIGWDEIVSYAKTRKENKTMGED
jgi:hypothetical protein